MGHFNTLQGIIISMNITLKNFVQPYFFIPYALLIIFSYIYWDTPVAQFFQHISFSPSIDVVVNIINDLGLGWFYILGLPIAAYIAKRYKRHRLTKILIFIWLGILFAGIICDVLKVIFGRARPDALFDYQHDGFYWFQESARYWSMPSGHATVITAVMAGCACFKPRYTLVFLSVALIISAARVVLTQHYVSDILAGMYLAVACVYFLHAFFLKKGYYLR